MATTPDEKWIFFLITALASVSGAFLTYWITWDKAYKAEQGKNQALTESVGTITRIVEKEKNLVTKEHIGEITTIVEKAKNLATKEDIGEITEKIELIKGQLTFLTQAKLSYNVAERQAVVDCYTKYSLWFNSLVNVSFSFSYGDQQIERLQKEEQKINDLYSSFFIALSTMHILIRNPILTRQYDTIRAQTFDLMVKVVMDMLKFTGLLREMNNAQNELDPIAFEQEETRLREQMKIVAYEGIKDRNERNAIIWNLNMELINSVYDHLQKIMTI